MGETLREIAQKLKIYKKVQLIYAFNGTGKTRLSREFKELIDPKSDTEINWNNKKILYYSAFTEDLFYWDNDLNNDIAPTLQIQPNTFTQWIFEEQGKENEVAEIFQQYTDEKLTPHFNAAYENDMGIIIPAFSTIKFSYERGDTGGSGNIKISKGEESCFIWSVFYSLLEQVVNVLNTPETQDRETNQFDNLEYVFIDDPVSSLDENHLIELAVNLAQLIRRSESELKFVITTHNPLFYNVLHNEFRGNANKYFLKKDEQNQYELIEQSNDSPFSYHLSLLAELENAIETNQFKKYHFNFLRNILEKTSTFLGYETWGELLPPNADGKPNPYETRLINILSHSKYSAEEIIEVTDDNKRMLGYLLKEIKKNYKFK